MSEFDIILKALESQIGPVSPNSPQGRRLKAVAEKANLSPEPSTPTSDDLDTAANHRGKIPPRDPTPGVITSDAGPSLHPIIFRSFSWGFQLQIPDDTLHAIVGTAQGASTFLSLISAVSGPAAPFMSGVASFLSVAAAACNAANVNGNGIFLSMLWAVPGAFVPTPT